MTDPDDSGAALRRIVYALLIVVATGATTGRVLSVSSRSGKTPFLSANDRSRWSTIRSLVDHRTFALDAVVLDARGRFDREWQTIDMVRHRGPDRQEHYYSSKPPLLPVLLAGEYWVIQQATGATLGENPFFVGRLMLLLTNVVPMAVMLLVLARIVERYGRTDAGRMFTMATAAMGTFLTTFAVTLNNHLPAAISVVFASDAVLRIVYENDRRWRWFVLAGLFAAFAAVNELPALSFTAALTAALFWTAPGRALAAFAPAAALVAAAFFATNWVAHASLRPAYAHRSDGPIVAELSAERSAELAAELDSGSIPNEVRTASQAQGVTLSTQAEVQLREPGRRWAIWDPQGAHRWAVVREKDRLALRRWDHWYDYENSYWTSGRAAGVDRGEPSIAVYALHVLIGHHGIFSLTPVWLLSLVGAAILLTRGRAELCGFAFMAATVTAVVLAFYIFRPLADRNYGGVTNGLRWSFWLIPLWLIVMLPAADAACSRPRRLAVALVLLLVSVFSVNYKPLNPWSHPWLFDYWSYLEWIKY